MAWIKIGRPGTKWGPCVKVDCGHVDCQQLRDLAEKVCTVCKVRIGYESPMTSAEQEQGEYDHLDCALVEADAVRSGAPGA